MSAGSSPSRAPLLVVAVVILIGAVALSRSDILFAHDDADAGLPTPRSIYLARASLTAAQDALLAQADRWRTALDRTEQSWGVARRSVVAARSLELAGARFRDMALQAIVDLDIASPAATVVPADAPTANTAMMILPLQLDVQFDARQHSDIYAAIDRLENMPGVRTNIESLRLDGPGRIQMPRLATVRLRLTALALIEPPPETSP